MILIQKCIWSEYLCCFRIWRFYRITNWRWCFRGYLSYLQMDKTKMSWCTIIYMGSFIGNCVSISANWCQWIIDLQYIKQKTFQKYSFQLMSVSDCLKYQLISQIYLCGCFLVYKFYFVVRDVDNIVCEFTFPIFYIGHMHLLDEKLICMYLSVIS